MLLAAGEAVWFLFRVLLVCGIYLFAKHAASTGRMRPVKHYAFAIGGALFLALYAWSGYGTHSETDDDGDPLYGRGGGIVQDFEPTSAQRNAHGVRLFIIVLIPALIGTYRGNEAAQTK